MKKFILVILVFMLYNCQVEIKQNPSNAGNLSTYIVSDNVSIGSNAHTEIFITSYSLEGV